ncbi:MAG: hypothetical protein ACRD6W_15555 [Nitrososphaerales archaeon]
MILAVKVRERLSTAEEILFDDLKAIDRSCSRSVPLGVVTGGHKAHAVPHCSING